MFYFNSTKLRGFDDVSTAISLLFRTVNVDECAPIFLSAKFSPAQLNFGNQNTIHFYKHIFEMNSSFTLEYKLNFLDYLSVSDYNVYGLQYYSKSQHVKRTHKENT
ncbi:hypothetical protein CRT22_24515 [Escherichia sp. E5028]|nr:hypothetical protein CRT22_24515 [Escherichia sp. E5028]